MKVVEAAPPTGAGRLVLPLRFEDVVIMAWVAAVSPLMFRIGGDKGPFDPGQTMPGLLRLGAVVGVIVCIAARHRPDPSAKSQEGMIQRGALGPLVGGLLLVTISGFTALDAPSRLVLALLLVAGIAMAVVRFAVPPLSTIARRALVSPFVAISGGLYWTFIESVIRPSDVSTLRHAAVIDLHATAPILLFLAAFSIVYYAMLVYAPRQVAEREGGWIEWLLRYAAFVVSIALGIGWLSIFSG